MAELVEKRAFLTGHTCRTGGWHVHHAAEEALGPGLKWRFYFGADVGRRARHWLGGGRYVRRTPLDAALRETEEAVREGGDLLFEASFVWGGLTARADALRRAPDGWTVIEIKSGLSPKEDYIDDLAYTVCVARGAGLPVTGAALVLINREYRIGGDAPMFVEVDQTAEALDRATALRENAQEVARTISAEQRPDPMLIFFCKSCGLFETECLGRDIPDPLFVLPRLSEKKFAELRDYERVSRIPSGANLTAPQQRVAEVIRSGREYVDLAALRVLDEIVWPVHYLDFETINPYLPWFEGRPPYDAVPFQYALCVRREPGAPPEHHEYLAGSTGDWRRELTEQLLADLGTQGSIVAYSSAEKTHLNVLAGLFPDLQEPLRAAAARIFDLERVFKDGYVHPGFAGRTSIKKVLPVLVKDVSYDRLAIGGGDDALGTFAFMRVGEYPPETHEAHRAHLLEYCALDARAMLELHDVLLRIRN